MATLPLLAKLFCITVLYTASASNPAKSVVSWTSGKDSWKAARSPELWDNPNACDPTALRSSASLTVLFGLSSIWDRIQRRRQEEGLVGKPLEVHVLGASYPFEGRSDWSFLAERRPADVPAVRVRLILGTPFQSDNVPPLALLSRRNKISPNGGKWSKKQEEIVCEGKGHYGTADLDKQWSKEEVCRDHGNGLEIICVEKFYQDVRDELPKPDLAVMFSPGFPQLGRRSWDLVLIGLLNDKVPTMISDVIVTNSWGHKLKLSKSDSVLPGGKWNPSAGIGEEWDTWFTMKKYGAHKIKARRGPFPILHREDDEVFAKNAVVQIYQGYKPGAQSTQPPSKADIAKYNKLFQTVNWKGIDHCPHNLAHMFAFPTSRPFDRALRGMYISSLRDYAHQKQSSLSAEQRDQLEMYGLLGSKTKAGKRKRWGLKGWVTVLSTLGCHAVYDEY